MGYIGKIKLPDNKTYDIKHTIIPVVGTQTAATGSWTGEIDVDSLYDGLTIAYFLPYAGSGNATLNLTLKDGTTTGAINCYYNSARLTTHYAKGSNIIMTYWSAGSINIDGVDTTDDRWIAQGNYADGNNRTQQTINNNNKDYPLLFSYAETNNTTTNVTNVVYRNNDYFINPSTGYIYSKAGFCAGPVTATAGKRVWVNQNGIYANNYLNGYSVSAYEKAIIKAWPGKHTSADGLLLTIDSGGLTMIGGGESSNNLAGLIDDNQTTTSPKRLDINNSAGASGKETTGFVGNSEQLILCSDDNIYFATNCQTLANRVAVCLDSNRAFYPMTDNSGSIGSSSYKWQYGYFGQVYGSGSSGAWRFARENASFIDGTPPTTDSYDPAIDLKTTSGDWSIGSLHGNENLYFSYVADSDYSADNNRARRYQLEAPDTPDNRQYYILHSGNTSFTRTLSSGTKIGSIEINNTSTDIYSPTIPSSLKNPHALTIDSKTYDGSSALTVGQTIHYIIGSGGTAANTTSGSYYAAKWVGTDSSITALHDGLTIAFKVEVAGHGTYGTVLNLNSLGEHPVVANVNSMVSTRYPVGSIVILVYDASQKANVYINNVSTSITGCWKVSDYDSINNWQLRHNNGNYTAKTALYRYMLCLSNTETTLLPINTVNNSTATNKTLTTTEFNPFGAILYYNSTTTINANAAIAANVLFEQANIDLQYSFNTGTTLTNGKDVYIVATPQSNGKAKLHSSPITQTLPTSDNGLIYIYLGHASSTSAVEIHPVHPVFWYKNGQLCLYTGSSIVTQTLRTTNNNYPILLSMYENTNTTTNVTNSVYRNNSVYVNTSVGSLHSNEVCTTKYRVSQYPNAVAMQVLAAGESALVEGEALHIGVSGLPTILRGSVSLVDGDLFFNMKPTGVSEQGEVIYGDESQGLIFKGYRGLYYDESVTPAIKVGNSALCLNLLGDGIYTNTDLNFARHTYTSSDMTTYGIILDGNMVLKVGEFDTVDFGIITKDMVLYSTAISADCDVTFSQTLYLSNTTDVAAATYSHPALVIGERDPSDHTMGQHIEFDSNEIMSKTNASTAGILYLQDESGSIQMGCGHITIGKGTVTNTNIVICGKTYKTNTFADNNPKIIFKDADWSQNLSLTFTDFNDVGGNASITLNGNQGGEYFIAPYIKATSGWINPSDRRLKQNIQSLDSRYLNLIKNLNPVSFNFKDEKSDTKTHAGFIAQEVQEAIEKVGLDNEDIAAIIKPYTEEGYYELSYTEFIPMLLLYIKDLEKQIKEIKEKEKY